MVTVHSGKRDEGGDVDRGIRGPGLGLCVGVVSSRRRSCGRAVCGGLCGLSLPPALRTAQYYYFSIEPTSISVSLYHERPEYKALAGLEQ